MELVGVFTRRNPENVKVRTAGVKVLEASELEHMQDQIDVLVLAAEARRICRFRHPNMQRITTLWTALIPTQNPGAFRNVDAAAKKGGKNRHYFLRLGSGNVLLKPLICKLYSAGRTGLYLLGQGRQSGSFRCGSSD